MVGVVSSGGIVYSQSKNPVLEQAQKSLQTHGNQSLNRFLNFTDSQSRFSFEYPNNWKWSMNSLGDGSIVFTPNTPEYDSKLPLKEQKRILHIAFFGPKIGISVSTPLFPDTTSSELCSRAVGKLNGHYPIFHEGLKTLPNVPEPVCTVQFIENEGEDMSHPVMLFATIHKGLMYFINYSAATEKYFSQYMPVLDHILSTFKFNK